MTSTNYPQLIETAALDVAKVNLRITDYRRALETLNDAIAFEVVFAVSPETGKPLFSNEQQRSTAIRERQRDSDQYQNLQKNLDASEMNKAMAAAKLERLRNEFSVWKLERREAIAAMERADE